MDMRKVVAIFFVLEFIILMLFYGYAYPIVPFWGDDWQYLASYSKLTPHDSWIPARILPKYAQSGIGIFASYVVMPISGWGFLDSIALAMALCLSSAFVALSYIIYRIALVITKDALSAIMSCSVFIIGIFCVAKSSQMPLLLPADLNAQGMGYLLTMTLWYTLPYVCNLAFVGLCVMYLLKAIKSLNFVLLGGGNIHHHLFNGECGIFKCWICRGGAIYQVATACYSTQGESKFVSG